MRRPRRFWKNLPKPAARWSRLFALGVAVGVLGGGAAAVFERGIEIGTQRLVGQVAHLGSADTLRFDWRVLLFPAAGGLISGILVRVLCPTSRGHGTDLVIRAFHHQQGALPLRGPAVRAVANVGVLSFGGSTGPEGPAAALGAAIGSTVGRIFRLSARERRIALLAGCAAAVGAIFRCPLGGAMFATSVLYREEEFESGAIVPSFVASVIGYSVFMSLSGGLGKAIYLLPGCDRLGFQSILELGPYLGLGVLCGLATILFTASLRFVDERLIPASRLPRWLAPAIGGLATGAIACVLPQVMDSRYQFVKNAMAGFDGLGDRPIVWAGLFGMVVLFKCVATACTVGSGGSGGALGPSVFLGGVIGAFWGAVMLWLWPNHFHANGMLRHALIPVGMGGVLAAVMRTPLAAIVMVIEMTGSYGLIVPLMLTCVSAYVVGGRWGLNREQLRSMAQSPAHAGDAIVHLLESWRVADLMEREWPETVAPNTTLREMVLRLKPGTRPVFTVVKDGMLIGIVSTSDIRRNMENPLLAEAIIASDIMTQRLTVVYPEEDMYEAMNSFRRSRHPVLPVVSRSDGRWLGMLPRERVFEAVQRQLLETRMSMFAEHAGLAGMQQEGEIQQLMTEMGSAQQNRIQRLMVPMDAVGKSIREADFRKSYGAQIIAVEQADGSVTCPPDLDSPLTGNQRLVAIVS